MELIKNLRWNHSTRNGICVLIAFGLMGAPQAFEEFGLSGWWSFLGVVISFAALASLLLLIGSSRTWQSIDEETEILSKNPSDVNAYLRRGRLFEPISKKKALKDYKTAITIAPENVQSYYQRAEFLINENARSEALLDLDKVIALDPDFKTYGALSKSDVLEKRAFTYFYLERYQDAINDFDRVIEADQKSAYFYKYRAASYRKLNKYQNAISDFEMALTLTPSSTASDEAEIHRSLAEVLNQAAQEKALPEISESTNVHGSTADALNQVSLYESRAKEFCRSQEFDLALKDYQHALSLVPAEQFSISARLHKAVSETSACAVSQKNHYRSMLYGVKMSILESLRKPDMHPFAESSDLEAAEAPIALALNSNSQNAMAFKARGDANRAKNLISEAIRDYSAALRLTDKQSWKDSPRSHPAEIGFTCFKRGDLYMRQGVFDQAISDFTNAISLTSAEEPKRLFHLLRGDCYQSLGKLQDATTDYAIALNRKREDLKQFATLRLREIKENSDILHE